ncbi:MAG: DUF4177 domain-containing protein [Lysobacteraceae bacterium]
MQTYRFLRSPVTHRAGRIDPTGYEQLVHDQAADGWELVQIFVEQPAATAGEYVLIFRRPAG